jgi:hypothetical protein
MSALLLILRIEAALCCMFGLWSHDWRLIIAGMVCFCVSPMVRRELADGS